MKYAIIVGDGMADRPVPEIGGRTPLEAADTPHLDALAARGRLGTAVTIPAAAPEAGSDVGNLSILGYDPLRHACGRGPLEAANMGIELGSEDTAFRCNLVTRDGDRMADYSAGHISSEEAGELIKAVNEKLGGGGIEFYPGVSYRHLMVWRRGPAGAVCHPPHDFSGGSMAAHWPSGPGAEALGGLIRASWAVLDSHPVNLARAARGEAPANSIWFWGQGRAPRLETIPARFGLAGVVISAVDLVNGLGRLAGLTPVRVPGATGYLDSNLAGKAAAALQALADHDLAYVHVEAPDEASHEGSLVNKIKAIELFDAGIVGPIVQGLKSLGPHRVLVMPDHYTPLEARTHTREPVPFVVYDSEKEGPGGRAFNEAEAANGEWRGLPGPEVIGLLLG
ncbi:MAG: cofactor-independent phosphoglycerate mutase [Patescibacteria group bacterium]